jgi:hypothetical protein
MRGAREVRSSVVDNPKAGAFASIVVWIPMLPSDDRTAAEAMTAVYTGTPIPQFWDGETQLGAEVSRSLGIDPAHVSWDIYLFYPPDAEWTDAGLPPPSKVIAQAANAVIGSPGTLPPRGDQSRIPEWVAGRAVVVGEQRELGALLGQLVDAITASGMTK